MFHRGSGQERGSLYHYKDSVSSIKISISNSINSCYCIMFCRAWDHDDPVTAVQLSLKNLQLDYIDLYLVHAPFRLRKDVSFANLTEEDKLGYSSEVMAECWKVGILTDHKGFTDTFVTFVSLFAGNGGMC